MKHALALLVAAFVVPAIAQQVPSPPMPSGPIPQLSTADKLALQTCEKVKQDARKAFEEGQQQETTVLREWTMSHPGFHINTDNFLVEADRPLPPPPVAAPPAEPKPTKK